MKVEISLGEFFDKISILKIKCERISEEGKRANVMKEYQYLIGEAEKENLRVIGTDFFDRLIAANTIIWEGEEILREKQRLGELDSEFTKISDLIHRTNDLRAQIKKEINLALNSNFIEEKSHQK